VSVSCFFEIDDAGLSVVESQEKPETVEVFRFFKVDTLYHNALLYDTLASMRVSEMSF
jgi:hypothetical protein